MQAFGTEPYGDEKGFKLICCKCGKDAKIVPVHHYKDDDYKTPDKITLELRCVCGNRYGATIHS